MPIKKNIKNVKEIKNMATKKLADYAIDNGTQVGVRGVVTFSHVTKKLEGKALEAANKNTKYPSTEGYYTMSVEIVENPVAKALRVLDVNDKSQVELANYCYDHIYESKKAENAGKKFFRANSKAPNPPRVFKYDKEGKLVELILDGKELAAGTKVQLIMNYFTTKFNPGVGLNAIIVEDDDIKFFEPSVPTIKGFEMSSAAPIRVGADTTDVQPETVDSDQPAEEFVPIAETTDKPDEDTSFAATLAKFMG